MFDLAIDSRWSAQGLYALFAERRFDPTFPSNFSDRTPWSLDACVQRVQGGQWLPFVVTDGPDTVAMHYLHDIDAGAGTTWVSGYVMPSERGRGRLATYYKLAMWEVARQHIFYTWGYRQIFAYVLATNRAGNRWAIECCQLTEVGLMHHAVPEGEGMADIVVYTQMPSGADECRRQATTLFPEGWWG